MNRDATIVAMVTLLTVCLSSSSSRADQPHKASPSAAGLLDRYERGEFDAVAVDLVRVDLKAILTETRRMRTGRRPEVLAAFLLEASAAACQLEIHPRQPLNPSGARIPDAPLPHDVLDLFAESFAAAELAPAGTPFDHAWHRAAVALLEGAVETAPQDTGSGIGGAMLGSSYNLGDKGDFLHRMADRIDLATKLMAQASLQESVVWTMLSYNLPAYEGHTTGSAGGGVLAGNLRGNLDRALDDGIARLTEAQTHPEVRAEATVRRGWLTAVRKKKGDVDLALQLLREAQQLQGDNAVRYLAHFLEGRVLESQGQLPQATAAYQAALAIMPAAQSGRLALAALNYVQGKSDEAHSLVEAVLTSPVNADDPWALYHYGEYRNWPARIRAVREALR